MYSLTCEVWECPFPHNLANTWFDQSFKLWPTHEIRVFQYLHLYFPSHQAFRSHFSALLNGGCAPWCGCPLPLLCHHRQPGCLLQLQVKSRFQSLCAQGHTARSLRKSPGWVTPSFSVIGAPGAHLHGLGWEIGGSIPAPAKAPFLQAWTWRPGWLPLSLYEPDLLLEGGWSSEVDQFQWDKGPVPPGQLCVRQKGGGAALPHYIYKVWLYWPQLWSFSQDFKYKEESCSILLYKCVYAWTNVSKGTLMLLLCDFYVAFTLLYTILYLLIFITTFATFVFIEI